MITQLSLSEKRNAAHPTSAQLGCHKLSVRGVRQHWTSSSCSSTMAGWAAFRCMSGPPNPTCELFHLDVGLRREAKAGAVAVAAGRDTCMVGRRRLAHLQCRLGAATTRLTDAALLVLLRRGPAACQTNWAAQHQQVRPSAA